MSVRNASFLFLITLLMIHGGYGQNNYGVSYGSPHICALQGSTVTMSCTFGNPYGSDVITAFWTKTKAELYREPPDLSRDPEYSQRLQYMVDKQQYICNLRLSDVTKKDEHQYYFTYVSNGARWTGDPGVSLSVTDLQVESPERVKEGDTVHLTCQSSCKLTDTPTFIWYRNSHPLLKGINENKLTLMSISRSEAGNYQCGVQEPNSVSPAVYLDVSPTDSLGNPVISISRSGKIVSGNSVTLSCSSDSNPPAEINWFKESEFVGSGVNLIFSRIRSDDSGEYKCRAINVLGEKYSNPVAINVKYPPNRVSVSIQGSGKTVSGDSVTLICSSDSNPPAEIDWFKETQFIGSGKTYIIFKISSDDSGEYKCSARNEHGEKDSDYVTLNVKYLPKRVSVSINGSAEIVSGDSLTLSCSSDSNPPAETTWFKGSKYIGFGRTFIFSKINTDGSGEYTCKARNEHGETYSDPVILNVMYPPRSVLVSIIDSSQIGSVTLSCRSDSNPTAEISWFKENQSSAVGSGQSFIAVESRRFYCEARNQHGSDRSNIIAVTVREQAETSIILIILASLGMFIIILIIISVISCKKRVNRGSAVNEHENNNPGTSIYETPDLNTRSLDLYDTLTTFQDQIYENLEEEDHQVFSGSS